MTFLIRWAGRLMALGSIVFLVVVVGVFRAMTTPPKATRVYHLKDLAELQPLASANLTHQIKSFMDNIPKVTSLTLDVPEIQANALTTGALMAYGIPLSGSRLILEPNQTSFTMAVNLSELQAVAPNEKIKSLRLPFPLDKMRTRTFTVTLISNLQFDKKAGRLELSESTLLLGQLDMTSAPRVFWNSQMGRGMVRVIATALGMDDMAALKLSTTDASVGLLTSVIEETLNGWLQDLVQDDTLKIEEFAISRKNIKLVLGLGNKILAQIEHLDKVRNNPYYYGVTQQKILGGNLSASECESAKRSLENFKKNKNVQLGEEEKEALNLLKELVEKPDSPCNLSKSEK